jgi:hypothetical protein
MVGLGQFHAILKNARCFTEQNNTVLGDGDLINSD